MFFKRSVSSWWRPELHLWILLHEYLIQYSSSCFVPASSEIRVKLLFTRENCPNEKPGELSNKWHKRVWKFYIERWLQIVIATIEDFQNLLGKRLNLLDIFFRRKSNSKFNETEKIPQRKSWHRFVHQHQKLIHSVQMECTGQSYRIEFLSTRFRAACTWPKSTKARRITNKKLSGHANAEGWCMARKKFIAVSLTRARAEKIFTYLFLCWRLITWINLISFSMNRERCPWTLRLCM